MSDLHCMINIDDSDEIFDGIYSKKRQWLIHGCALLLLLLGLVQSINTNFSTSLVIMTIVFISIIVIELFLNKQTKKLRHVFKERLKENNNKDTIEYHFQFNDETCHIHNVNTQGQVDLQYTLFKKYIETTHYVVLMTQAQQFIIFNKEVAHQHDLKSFLIEKNPSIKVK